MKAKIAKTNATPDAWVVNSTDNGRYSIKNGKVYLKENEEFKIELFNPLTECVLADIKVNGSSICKTGLVLNPGQRFFLASFIDDKKKFIFKTYDVEVGVAELNAISKNGLLEVYFYKENVVSIPKWQNLNIWTVNYPPCTTYPTYQPTWVNPICYGNGSYTTNGTIYGTTNTIMGENSSIVGYNFSPFPNKITTGRVEKGSESDQEFTTVNKDFEQYFISFTKIELLPDNRKPIETNDLVKDKNKNNDIDKILKTKDKIYSMLDSLNRLKLDGILSSEQYEKQRNELINLL